MSEPIEFVGGQPEGKRPRVWPYVLIGGFALMVLVGATVIFWAPLRTFGRSLANDVVPYSLEVDGRWSDNEKVVGGPVVMSLNVRNATNRDLNGITLRMRGLTPGWRVLSAQPDAEVKGDSIFFRDGLVGGQSEALEVKLMPLRAGQSSIQLTLSAGSSTRPIKIRTPDGGSDKESNGLTASVTVREATPADVAVRPRLYFATKIASGKETSWDLRIENAGAVRITAVTLQFPELPRSFEVTSTDPKATVSGDGHTVRFATTLDPGDDATMTVRFVPHQQGNFHVAAQLYLNDEARPLRMPDGANQVPFDVTVS